MADSFLLTEGDRRDSELEFQSEVVTVVGEKSWIRKIHKCGPTTPHGTGIIRTAPARTEQHQRLRVRHTDGTFETVRITGDHSDALHGDRITLLWARPDPNSDRQQLAGICNHTAKTRQSFGTQHIAHATSAYGALSFYSIATGVVVGLFAWAMGHSPSDFGFWGISFGTALCIGCVRVSALYSRVARQVDARLKHLAGGRA